MYKEFFSRLAFLLPAISFSQNWVSVGGGLGGDVHGFTIWNNKLAIGGSFNNNPCDKIAAWDGNAYSCFGAGIGSVVRAVIDYNGDLVAVGDFWNVNQPCTDCNGVARWDGTQWTAMGTGFNNDVLTLTIWNGQVVAAGDFTTADGNPVSRIARWNGSAWVGMGTPTDFDNDIRAMAVYHGELYVGGDFANAGGCTGCDRIARWNGTGWEGGGAFNMPGGLDSTVRALHVFNDELFMGGHFLEVAGDVDMAGIAKYDGFSWGPLDMGVNSYVRGITDWNFNIIIGGDFTDASGTPANRVALWDGSSWSAMGTGMDAYLRTLITYDGNLYAGGSFHNAGGNTCDYIAMWYVPPPAPVAMFTANQNAICTDSCIQFTDQSANDPTSWDWDFPGGNPSSSTQENPIICYDNPGIYDVTLIVTNVTGSDTIFMQEYILVSTVPVPDAGNDDTLCVGTLVQLNASGGNDYLWSPASGLSCTNCQSPFASPTITTTYYAEVFNGGCGAIDSVTLFVLPAPSVQAGSDASICAGQSTTLNGSGPITLSWSPPSGLSNPNIPNPIATPTSTTTYTLTGTGANGCSAQDAMTVTVNPNPVANFMVSEDTVPVFVDVDFTFTGSIAVSWNWNFGDGNISNFMNPSHQWDTPGDYMVNLIATSAFNCQSTAQLPIHVTEEVSADIQSTEHFQIFPNPAEEIINIQTNLHFEQWKITDRMGRILLIGNSNKINLENLSGGIYFLLMDMGDGEFFCREFGVIP